MGSLGATVPPIDIGGAFAVEFLLSFVLMLVIMAMPTDERVADGFAGLAVGLTVGFDAMTGGPLTGASMNPARSLGAAVAGDIWTAHWIYWLALITATIVAAKVYDFLRVARVPEIVPKGIAVGVQGPLDGEREELVGASGSA